MNIPEYESTRRGTRRALRPNHTNRKLGWTQALSSNIRRAARWFLGMRGAIHNPIRGVRHATNRSPRGGCRGGCTGSIAAAGQRERETGITENRTRSTVCNPSLTRQRRFAHGFVHRRVRVHRAGDLFGRRLEAAGEAGVSDGVWSTELVTLRRRHPGLVCPSLRRTAHWGRDRARRAT